MEKRITLAEASVILGLSTQTVSKRIKEGLLTSEKEGRKIVLREAEVLEFKESQPTTQRGRPAATQDEVTPVAPPTPPIAAPVPLPDELSEIPIGAVIEVTNKLTSPVWRMNSETKVWENPGDVNLSVKVVERNNATGLMFLMCRAPGSDTFWGISESDVLAKKFNLIQLPLAVPSMPPAAALPAPTPEKPAVDEAAQKAADKAAAAEKALMEEKIAYSAAINAYATSNESKLSSAAEFKKVNKEHRPTIWSYVEKYGVESEEGKRDQVIEDFGHKAILTFTEGQTVTEYQMAEIVTWAIANGQTGILTYAVDIAKWNELKEAGAVPAEFIASVEKPKTLDDQHKLLVSKLKKGGDKK